MVLKSLFIKLFVLDQASGQTGKQGNRQAGRQASGQTGKQGNRQAGKRASRQAGKKRCSLLKITFFLGNADQDSLLSSIARKSPAARSFLVKQAGRKQQLGQVTIELILILTLLVGMATTIPRILDDGTAEQLISRPWEKISIMIESGNWTDNTNHPALDNYRHLSVKGEDVQ